jgi:hypothetical protein
VSITGLENSGPKIPTRGSGISGFEQLTVVMRIINVGTVA